MMTITTTPELIYLLLAIFNPSPGALGFDSIFQGTDQVACKTQADDWTAKLAPTKFVCVAHRQKVLKNTIKGNGNTVWFVGKVRDPTGGVSYVKLYEAEIADKDACDTQAKDWTKQAAPNEFLCLKHTRSKLEDVPSIPGSDPADVMQ